MPLLSATFDDVPNPYNPSPSLLLIPPSISPTPAVPLNDELVGALPKITNPAQSPRCGTAASLVNTIGLSTVPSAIIFAPRQIIKAPSLNRPMQGQSPYLINLGIQYDIEKLGLNTTLLFNQIGRRIYYVGGSDVPPVWEAPRPLLDLQIAKKVMKNKGEIKLNISDIINQTAKFYHDLNDNGKYDANVDALAIQRKYGSSISISFGYKIK